MWNVAVIEEIVCFRLGDVRQNNAVSRKRDNMPPGDYDFPVCRIGYAWTLAATLCTWRYIALIRHC